MLTPKERDFTMTVLEFGATTESIFWYYGGKVLEILGRARDPTVG